MRIGKRIEMRICYRIRKRSGYEPVALAQAVLNSLFFQRRHFFIGIAYQVLS